MNFILQCNQISKKYGGKTVLNNLSVSVPKGSVYGLLGENGAGKTTTMKIITGLAKADTGSILFQGQNLSDRTCKFRRKMGCLIETPTIFPYMNASQNLKAVCLERNITSADIKGLLTLVGLSTDDKTLAKNFSLGMKQRLGVALALLGDPELVILDEPINGLDPMGIIEFRNLIQSLNSERGITFVISSHILSELYNVATDFAFIRKGTVLEETSKTALDTHLESYLSVKFNTISVQNIQKDLSQMTGVTEVRCVSENEVHLYFKEITHNQLTGELYQKYANTISETNYYVETLENYYLRIMKQQKQLNCGGKL